MSETEITYKTKECTHSKMTKIAPMWYFCDRCGKIFNFILSLQFSMEEALSHQGKIVDGITKQQKKIINAQLSEKKRDEKAERQAIDNFKKATKIHEEKQNIQEPKRKK